MSDSSSNERLRDLIDVELAARLAAKFSASSPLERSYLMEGLEPDLASLVEAAEPLVSEETGFIPSEPAFPIVLTRAEWARANIDSLLSLMRPLLEKVEQRIEGTPMSGAARMAYRPALGLQLGAVLGYVSQKVLGQYDVLAPRTSEIWFVGPNIVLTERRHGFVPRDFRLWIVLHELTHRAQFEGMPWVKDYFLSSVQGLMESFRLDPGPLLERIIRAIRTGSEGPLALLDADQRSEFMRLQAFMSVIEGHGNFVMDRIAAREIPTHGRMRLIFSERASTGGPLAKVIRRVLGLDLKRLQYEEGQRFFNQVFAHGGPEAVRAVLSSKENLPTIDEVRSPDAWLARAS